MIIQVLKDKLITWILRIKRIFLMNSLKCLIQSWIISMDKLSSAVMTSAAKGKLQSRGIFSKEPLRTVLLIPCWYWAMCRVCGCEFNIMKYIATKRIIFSIIIKQNWQVLWDSFKYKETDS